MAQPALHRDREIALANLGGAPQLNHAVLPHHRRRHGERRGKDAGPGLAEDGPSAATIEQLALANKLIALGDARKDPVLLIAAAKLQKSLSTEAAGYLIEKVRPELAVITHFGMRVIQENPETQAKWIEDSSGVKTVAARDNMCLDIEKDGITVSDRLKPVPDK